VLFNTSTIDLSSPIKTNPNVSVVTRDISCVCPMACHSKIDYFDPSNDVIHFHILTQIVPVVSKIAPFCITLQAKDSGCSVANI
jgi:hypothetical protein